MGLGACCDHGQRRDDRRRDREFDMSQWLNGPHERPCDLIPRPRRRSSRVGAGRRGHHGAWASPPPNTAIPSALVRPTTTTYQPCAHPYRSGGGFGPIWPPATTHLGDHDLTPTTTMAHGAPCPRPSPHQTPWHDPCPLLTGHAPCAPRFGRVLATSPCSTPPPPFTNPTGGATNPPSARLTRRNGFCDIADP